MELSEVIEEVNKSEISSIIQVIAKLISVINDPESSAKDMKDIIEKDPPLAANILKLSNSAVYGYSRRIMDIQEAVVCIGYDALKELALGQKVCELFRDDSEMHGYKRIELWRFSFATAYFCKLVSRREYSESGENLFVTALLHDIGILIIDQFYHETFLKIIKRFSNEEKNLHEIENEELGFDHTDIGRELFDQWNLPENIVMPIGRHHDPLKEKDEFTKSSVLVYLGNYFCNLNNMGFGQSQYNDINTVYKCMEIYNLSDAAMSLIAEDVQEEIKKMENEGFF